MIAQLQQLDAPTTPAGGPPMVSVRGASKRFGNGTGSVLALAETSFQVPAGQFICLLGPSGCGKSTVLNLVAGLDRPTGGAVQVADARPALMFQDAALFPWLTVEQNVAFPLTMRGVAKAPRRRRVAELLAVVNLTGFAGKRPHELSGGMRQRVALARALAQQSHLLLMDEPFGSLDAMLRDRLHDELEAVWRDGALTVLFVTHDVREAVRLGDRVLILSSRPGRIVADIEVALPRPRRAADPAAAQVVREITNRLRQESRR